MLNVKLKDKEERLKKRSSFSYPPSQITAIAVFILLFIESLENYIFFSKYFPRGGIFALVLNKIMLKFMALPSLWLTLVTIALYFCIVYSFIYLALIIYRSLTIKTKLTRLFFTLFLFLSVYLALYMFYGYNAYLHPRSKMQHFILYLFVFPKSDNNLYITAIAGYWSILFLLAVRAAKNKLPLIAAALIIILIVFFSQSLSFVNAKTFTKKGNLIFVGADSFQYNRLTKDLGYAKDLAPNAGEFIKESVCFTNCWTPLARTYPAYTSILTGRYPINNGIRDNLVTDNYIDKHNKYLAEILKENGYYGFYCTDDVRFCNINKRHGFDKIFCPRKDVAGFLIAAYYDYAFSNVLLQTEVLPWLFKPVLYNRAHVAYNPKLFIKNAIKQINNLPRDKPVFIVIHLCSDHHPYSAAGEYVHSKELENFAEQCIKMVDDQLGVLFKYLKQCGLYNNSDIVFFSDHGDGWDYNANMTTHGSNFYYPWANRMVLAFHFVDKTLLPKKVNTLISGVDIYPTILEKKNLPLQTKIDGKSLVPLIYNGVTSMQTRRVFAETGYSFDFDYNKQLLEANKSVQTEIKNFKVDPDTGYVYINDLDYKDVIQKKWYMILEDDSRFTYNPYYKKMHCYQLDTQTGSDVREIKDLRSKKVQGLLKELKSFFKL